MASRNLPAHVFPRQLQKLRLHEVSSPQGLRTIGVIRSCDVAEARIVLPLHRASGTSFALFPPLLARMLESQLMALMDGNAAVHSEH